jgi:cytidine deaminase
MPQTRRQYDRLIRFARKAQKHSLAPFSRFRVGAALLADDGTIYTGCNVENSSYGLTMCAERTALFKAVSEGERKFRAMAIVSDDDGYTSPCGACRQVILDLAGNIAIVLADQKGNVRVHTIGELLPHPFTAQDLRRYQRKKR